MSQLEHNNPINTKSSKDFSLMGKYRESIGFYDENRENFTSNKIKNDLDGSKICKKKAEDQSQTEKNNADKCDLIMSSPINDKLPLNREETVEINRVQEDYGDLMRGVTVRNGDQKSSDNLKGKVPPSFDKENILQQILTTQGRGRRESTRKYVVYTKMSKDLQGSGSAIDDESVRENSSSFPFRICMLCDKFLLKDKTITATDCEHSFCYKCGRDFFEEKFEQGFYQTKCPVFKCDKLVNVALMGTLVSKKHYETFLNRKNDDNQKIGNFMDQDHKYLSQKHVIDVNSNESFFKFNKMKGQFCAKCLQPALYGKTSKTFVKCLNCFNAMCKFCTKNYTHNHFDISSGNYCRIYFRKRLQNMSPKKKSCCFNYWYTVLTYLASFVVLLLFFNDLGCKLVRKILCIECLAKAGSLATFFYYILAVIVCAIITPLTFLTVPYIPVLINLS